MLHIAVFVVQVGITDYSTHEPPALELPAAGETYVDPVFGTTILRVTDEADGQRCVNAYAYWPALNLDATRLLIACDDEALLYRFDPVALEATREGALGGPGIQFEGATWSSVDPDVLYGLQGMRLWRIDVETGDATVLRDFAGLFSYAFSARQLAMADGDRIFTWHSRSSGGAKLDAVVWDRETGETFVYDRGGWGIDETKVSKDGRWIMLNGADGETRLWDFRAGITDVLEWGDPDDKPGGHADLGREIYVNSDGWDTGLIVRRFDAPHGDGIRNIVRYLRPGGGLNWSIADHVSMRVDSDAFVIGSTYGGDGSWSAFEDEIYLAYVDGSGFVRLAHTRSRASEYWAFPRAVVDRSGRFVVWSSDLGSSDRIDVLLLEIPWDAPPPIPGVDAGILVVDAGTFAPPDAAPPAAEVKKSGGCAAAPGGSGAAWLIALLEFTAMLRLVYRKETRPC